MHFSSSLIGFELADLNDYASLSFEDSFLLEENLFIPFEGLIDLIVCFFIINSEFFLFTSVLVLEKSFS